MSTAQEHNIAGEQILEPQEVQFKQSAEEQVDASRSNNIKTKGDADVDGVEHEYNEGLKYNFEYDDDHNYVNFVDNRRPEDDYLILKWLHNFGLFCSSPIRRPLDVSLKSVLQDALDVVVLLFTTAGNASH